MNAFIETVNIFCWRKCVNKGVKCQWIISQEVEKGIYLIFVWESAVVQGVKENIQIDREMKGIEGEK